MRKMACEKSIHYMVWCLAVCYTRSLPCAPDCSPLRTAVASARISCDSMAWIRFGRRCPLVSPLNSCATRITCRWMFAIYCNRSSKLPLGRPIHPSICAHRVECRLAWPHPVVWCRGISVVCVIIKMHLFFYDARSNEVPARLTCYV